MSGGIATPAGRFDGGDVSAVDASTIVLVRDATPASGAETGGSQGRSELQVLLLERHLDSDFAGGALVFPGGKVDPADRELAPERWRSAPLEQWRTALGAQDVHDALGLLVAAVRETFEEAGVLLALRADGQPVGAADLDSPSYLQARQRLADREQRWDWRPWLEQEGLILDLGALALWSWWVTPAGQHKRFDTRFFLAVAPTDQVARHDEVETTDLAWMRPEDALAAQRDGAATIIFPTRRNLEALTPFGDADTAWRAALAGEVDQRRIEPTVVKVDGVLMVQHPYEDSPSSI